MTIEDPIEFLHQHKKCIVNQGELGLRRDQFRRSVEGRAAPDSGRDSRREMRDLETISTAITAAETGHLVFATLHTQDQPQTIDRIVDVLRVRPAGQIRAQLSVALQGIMTQTLRRRRRRGALRRCRDPGPKPGRPDLIREAKSHQIYSVLQTGGQFAMQTMDASLATLVRTGKITQQLAEIRALHAADELRRLLAPRRQRQMAPPDRCPTYVFKAMDLAGFRPRARSTPSPSRTSPTTKQRGLVVVDIAQQVPLARAQHRVVCPGEAGRAGGGDPPALDDGTSGLAILRALQVLDDQVQAAPADLGRGPSRRRGRAALSDALERHPKSSTTVRRDTAGDQTTHPGRSAR